MPHMSLEASGWGKAEQGLGRALSCQWAYECLWQEVRGTYISRGGQPGLRAGSTTRQMPQTNFLTH